MAGAVASILSFLGLGPRDSAVDFDLPRDYDAAVLLHVLEHLFEPDAALQKVARRIRPGGVLIGGERPWPWPSQPSLRTNGIPGPP